MALGWLALRTLRRRDRPAASSYAVLLVSLAVTALCAAATAHTGTPYKLVWLYTGLAIPLALALFAFDYYGIVGVGDRTRRLAALAPAVAGALGGTVVVLGTPAMSPGATAPIPALSGLPPAVVGLAGTLYEAGTYYTTAVMLVAVGLVGRSVLRYDHLDARLAPVIAFVGVWPWVANLFVPTVTAATSLGVGVAGVAGGYTVGALAAAVAVGPLSLFESSPMAGTVGPDVVLDSMDDAVLVVDDEGHVLRTNAVARETFGVDEATVTGGPLVSVVDCRPAALTDGATVTLPTTGGRRTFAVTRSTVRDRTDAERGYALVLRDVTRRQTREQRLDVFNRILRHNLRNDATKIIGNARLIGDGGDPEQCADRIVDTTRELVGAAERARELDRIVEAPADATADLAPLVASVVEEVRETYPEVSVSTAVPDDVTVDASRDTVAVALRNVVENAAAHNDADDPLVVVSVDATADGVTVAVADNGPGIPDHERAVVERGEEDPLEHGSGLGLWTTQWAITAAGGSLSFGENDPRGAVVTLSLPAADRGAPDGAEADASGAGAGRVAASNTAAETAGNGGGRSPD